MNQYDAMELAFRNGYKLAFEKVQKILNQNLSEKETKEKLKDLIVESQTQTFISRM